MFNGIILGYFLGTIITFLLIFRAYLSVKNTLDNPIIKLNNEDECTIEEFNEMIRCDDCKICNIYEWADDCDDRCLECKDGNNYITHFKFVGIKSINNYEEEFNDVK